MQFDRMHCCCSFFEKHTQTLSDTFNFDVHKPKSPHHRDQFIVLKHNRIATTQPRNDPEKSFYLGVFTLQILYLK